jgi:Zn-dependent protease with chaperone function
MMARFFDHQQRRQRITSRLLFLTIIGSIGVGCLGGIALGLFRFHTAHEAGIDLTLAQLAPTIMLGAATTLAITAVVIFVKLVMLHYNRSSLRRFFKARDLTKENKASALNEADRRLLNVVEEMAIASVTTVPHVFVLDDDTSINAFAVVQSDKRSTIGVTAGARDNLNRDELQALIAHELGHIANGDAAINVRLLALIQGFRWIYDVSVSVIGAPFRIFDSFKLGFFFMFYLAILFGAFFVLGLFGVGIARLMQAAIARQREYLADASAVQFTRHTFGLLGALEKADNFRQGRRRRPTHIAAFMMFVSPYRARSWFFRTHPTIDQRIAAARSMTPGNIHAERETLAAAT